MPSRISHTAITLSICALAAIIFFAKTCSAAEDKGDSPLVVVDFENSGAVKLTGVQAKTRLIKTGTGHALQITTEAKAAYPGAKLTPAGGKWDLGGFDVVEMDVRNPQSVPVRVLLSLNNPGADRRRNCNTESINVPAKGTGTLVVPYGMWHGQAGNDMDWSNIVSMRIMLDKPKRSHTFTVDNIRATKTNRMTVEEAVADPFFKQLKPVFGRGVNLGNALEAPKERQWGVTLKEEYFDAIKSAGFDSVRIPVRWSAHADKSPPYCIEPEFFERVDWVVRNLLKRRIVPVLNMHHYNELTDKPVEHRERFLALWRQIAARYKGYPSALAFELLNEPHGNLNAEQWNAMAAEAIKVVRRTNPKRKIVVGPVAWNSLRKLNRLELPEDDRNLVVTFHYYDPFKFTHQGASWVGGQSRAWLGTKWTGTKAEKDAIIKDFDKAICWAVAHRRPIYLGEFGAYGKADMESRARWTKFIADEAAKRKIGFAYWEFCAGFGVYDSDRAEWVVPLKEALLGKGR